MAAQNIDVQLYTLVSGPLDAKGAVGALQDYNSIEALCSSNGSALYPGLRILDTNTKRIWKITSKSAGFPPVFTYELDDSHRVFTGSNAPTTDLIDGIETYENDAYICTNGDVYKKSNTANTWTSVVDLSSLVEGLISDTNTYPTGATFSTSGTDPKLTIAMGGTGSPASLVSNSLPVASIDKTGMVNTIAQEFAGVKTLNSPVFVNPTLGTPATGDLTNCTALRLVLGTVGTLTVERGGTGATTLTGFIKGNGTSPFTAVAKIALGSDVNGVLPIANGGTNNSSLGVTAGGVVYTDGSKLMNTGAGTSGQILKSNGAGVPSWVADSNTDTLQSVAINSTDADDWITFTGASSGAQTAYADDQLRFNPNSHTLKIYKIEGVAAGTTVSLYTASTGIVNLATNATTLNIGAANTTFKKITASGFSRSGVKNDYVSTSATQTISLADGNSHYINAQLPGGLLEVTMGDSISTLFSTYLGGSLLLTIRNGHANTLTVTFTGAALGSLNGETATLYNGEALTFSGYVNGFSSVVCYIYGVIAPASQNLM